MDEAHYTLQRLAVRMLHDPAFRAAVYADPRSVDGLGLPPNAHAMLTASDPRAWSIDAHRPTRVLKALLDEYAVSALALLDEGRRPEDHHAFFGSDAFHETVMRRGSLALAFGRYLDALASARAKPFTALEATIARVRRREPPTGGQSEQLACGRCEGCILPEGTLARWESASHALRVKGDPVGCLLDARRRPRLPRAAGGRGVEAVLVAQSPGDEPTVAFVGEALVGLLALGERWLARAAFVDAAVSEGVELSEANEIIDELVADGLLIQGGVPKK